MSDTDTTIVDQAPDLDIEVWYENPNTGGVFGYGLPLPKQILPQIKAGNLVRCAGPDGSGSLDSAAVVSEADGDGAADPGQEAVLYPCQDCGEVAAKDKNGYYTDYCTAHTPTSRDRRRSTKA